MELKQLQYFLTVAEHLNFSRAAEALYISQPALSYQIAELERELDTELFIRDRRKVSLTSAGAALLQPAREALDASRRLLQMAKGVTPKEEGILRIGFDSTEDHFETIGVTEQLARFATDHPNVRLEMIRAPFPECADQVIYGDLDAAFLIMRHKEHLPPDLTYQPVYRSKVLMVVREDSPAETCAEAIQHHDLILVGEKPRGTSRILRVLENMKLEPHIRQVDSMPAAFTYAQMGQGILLLSSVYYHQHKYHGFKAIDVPDEAAIITHMVVWNRGTCNPMVPLLLTYFPPPTEIIT